jgi:hypothetical protein
VQLRLLSLGFLAGVLVWVEVDNDEVGEIED